jgi:hypothetical protein
MKAKNPLLKLALVAQLSLSLVALSGCGSDSDATGGNVAASTVSGAAVTPAGSVADGSVPPPTNPVLTPPSGGGSTRPTITIGVNGNGPYKSSYITRNIGYSDSVGIDNNLRIKFNFGGATGSTGGTYAHNYTILRATVDLVIDGTVRATHTFTVGQSGNRGGFPSSTIANFSSAINTYVFGQGRKYISLRIRNIMNDNRIISGWCLSEPTNPNGFITSCGGAYYGYYNGSAVANCFQCPSGTWECFNSTQYDACVSRNTPVGDIQSSFGWSFSMEVEPDGAQL